VNAKQENIPHNKLQFVWFWSKPEFDNDGTFIRNSPKVNYLEKLMVDTHFLLEEPLLMGLVELSPDMASLEQA